MTEVAKEKDIWRPSVKAPKALVDKVGDPMNDEIMLTLLEGCLKIDASDLHLTVGEPPVYRVHGRLHEMVGFRQIDHEDMLAATHFFLGDDTADNIYWARYHEKGGADQAYSLGDKARFRVSCFRQREHPTLALRLIPTEILTFEEIGLDPEVQEDLLSRPRGLVLLTGPTGCGKSTTIASMVNWINENRGVHIITIEEPIEFFHNSKMSLVNQREVGVDVDSFAEAVVRNMRSDPDVMVVGEMRDLETMRAALQAAETGHLVFATLHTVSAPKTVDRLVSAFPSNEQEEIRAMTSTSLVAIYSQELIPRVDKAGRIAAHEVMIGEAGGSPAIGNLIRERKVSQMRTVIQSSRDLGMRLLEASLARLVNEGKIDFWEGYNRSNAKSDFLMFIDEDAMPEDVSEQILNAAQDS